MWRHRDRRWLWLRRTGASLAAAALAAVASVVCTAAPAAAVTTTIVNASWAATDLREPVDIQVEPAGDLAVGAWRDAAARRHVSRAYFTFDVAELADRFIYDATVVLTETAAVECADRQLRVWQTEDLTDDSSFVQPPAKVAMLPPGEGHVASPCPSSSLAWDATDAAQATADASASTLTIEVTVPGRYAYDLDHGRSLASEARLLVEYETLPLPRPLVSSPDYPHSDTGEWPYGTGIPGEFIFDARGVTDAARFQYQFIGGQVHFVEADEPGGSATVTLAPPAFANVLTVRSVRADGNVGAATNYTFNVRETAPMLSWDPAQVGVGVPITITITPVADDPVVTDVVEYVYRLENSFQQAWPEVSVDPEPDGTATFELTLPALDLYRLFIRGVHAAGWTSSELFYVLAAF